MPAVQTHSGCLRGIGGGGMAGLEKGCSATWARMRETRAIVGTGLGQGTRRMSATCSLSKQNGQEHCQIADAIVMSIEISSSIPVLRGSPVRRIVEKKYIFV